MANKVTFYKKTSETVGDGERMGSIAINQKDRPSIGHKVLYDGKLYTIENIILNSNCNDFNAIAVLIDDSDLLVPVQE